MKERVTWRVFVGLLVGAVLGAHLGCGGQTELPAGATAVPTAEHAQGESVAAFANAPPSIELRTRPPLVEGDPFPTVIGVAPLEVKFNLCRSSDPDQEQDGSGDSLTWQYHFGDSGAPAWNPDGSFNPDVSHHCRVTHTYREGTYTATVSVTDKHLEDQANDVSALARDTLRVTIESVGASGDPVPTPTPTPTPTPVLYCHNLPGFCTAATQFCETEPISHTNSDHAQNACETCFGVSCTDTAMFGNAWVVDQPDNYAFFYSGDPKTISCPGQYIWSHKPGDIATPHASAGTNCGAGTW